jgi:hypothetical protein
MMDALYKTYGTHLVENRIYESLDKYWDDLIKEFRRVNIESNISDSEIESIIDTNIADQIARELLNPKSFDSKPLVLNLKKNLLGLTHKHEFVPTADEADESDIMPGTETGAIESAVNNALNLNELYLLARNLIPRIAARISIKNINMTKPTPKDIAETLRRIASGIDNSKNPDPALVAKDIKNVISSLNPEPKKKELSPKDTVEALRKIASGIEASKKPDPALVAKDIKQLLSVLES